MTDIKTSLFDLQVDVAICTDPAKRKGALKIIEKVFEKNLNVSLKKENEHVVGGKQIVVYSVNDGNTTILVKTHPVGLITITFDDCSISMPQIFTQAENLHKSLQQELHCKVQKIPLLKRGTEMPVYLYTSDDRIMEYDFDRIAYDADSPYQNIKILHSPSFGNVLVLDDLQNLGESDISYTHGLMNFGQLSYCGKEVLILGGGDGAALHEILKEKPKHVTMVDIDEMVMHACRQHLREACGNSLDTFKGSNYEVIVDDCIKWLMKFKQEGKKFDIILNDLTDFPVGSSVHNVQGNEADAGNSDYFAAEHWVFVKKILLLAMDVLRDGGHYENHLIGEACGKVLVQYEELLNGLPFKVAFTHRSAYVPSFLEKWVFYDIWKV